MDYVCDTNVWYDIGSGRKDPARLKKCRNRLLATGINAIEIATRMSERDFSERTKAAQAVLDHADEYLKDPDYHLAELWGISVPPLKFNWKDVLWTVATAQSIGELNSGVKNFMRIDTQAAAVWRDAFSDKFVTNVIDSIRRFYPNYAAGRLTDGQMNYVDKTNIAMFKKVFSLPAFHEHFVLPTRARAADLALPGIVAEATQAEIDASTPKVMSFVKAYAAYVVKVATTFAPSQNDWGDMHCFVYLQGGRKMLTADKKWLDIARAAGLESEVIDSNTLGI